ncbi:MAG: metallophosphoesterase [Clostridia bacterium]|nr:metallophosphoesterase [Clostridia bacterium]
MFASETPTTVSIKFTGDEAKKAGFAQSEITVTPGDSCALSGYYLVYYTDGAQVLPDYDELIAIKINNGQTVKGNVGDGWMIPSAAKGIAVFECETYFTDETPDIKNAVAVAEIPESKRLNNLGKKEFSFGALSDTHMNYESYARGAYAKLRYSMDFFAEQSSEIVIISGDATGDRGENPDLEAQYEKHLEIIDASDFPADKVYESIGNHGNTPNDSKLLDKYLGGDDEQHPFENSPYFYVLYKGEDGERDNLFIFMAQEINAPGDSAAYDNFSKAQIDWLEDLLYEYGSKNVNIFILEHAPFLNYGAGDIENGTYTACVTFKEEFEQNMRLKGLLEQYKNAIVLSGHTHVSFYEGANYSDVYNSFARTVHIGSNCQPCAYGESASMIRSYDGRHNVTTEYGSEGYTVDVYSDFIVFTGYNFSTGKKIPAACLLIPTEAYGSALEPDNAFEGSGTKDDPYIIASAEDFKIFTDGFNASTSTTESEMYGYNKYFMQTADIDMTEVEGYSGTVANGNQKSFFAGVYNGNGHTVKVDINDSVQRSVFPYVYGVICNLKIEGKIASQASAQPVRTLYGAVINCIFELELSADIANGIIYSNYNTVYNVYSFGTLSGNSKNPVASNDTSIKYTNVFHCYTENGNSVSDSYGTRSNDIGAIVQAFNEHSGESYNAALALMKGVEMLEVGLQNGELIFEEVNADYSAYNEAVSKAVALNETDYTAKSWQALAEALAVDVSGLLAIEQEEVDAATKAINDAIDALVKGIKGDVNEDGSVLVVDYMLLKRYCLDTYKLNDAQKARADVNGDGNVTVVDYMLLKRYCLGTYEIK